MNDKRLDRIEVKLDDMHKDLVDVKLGYIEHERRSLANEKAVELLSEQFKPVHDLLLQVRLLHRILIWIGGTAALVVSILELLSYLK